MVPDHLHDLFVCPLCIQFSSEGLRVVLHPNGTYLPKVISAACSFMQFELLRWHSLGLVCLRYIPILTGLRMCAYVTSCFLFC